MVIEGLQRFARREGKRTLNPVRLNREKVLAASGRLGWVLAAVLVASWAFAATIALQAVQSGRATGRAEARAFIDKVRACHRAPKPHPTWTQCERLVQDRE
jgi:hypothetical protein